VYIFIVCRMCINEILFMRDQSDYILWSWWWSVRIDGDDYNGDDHGNSLRRIDLDDDNKISINNFCDCDTNDDDKEEDDDNKSDGEYDKDDSKCTCVDDDDGDDDYSSVQTN